MHKKPLVILLLTALCLILVIAISGCGQIKKIGQSGPSGPGQHADIGFGGWNQGANGSYIGWQEGLGKAINSGYALLRVDVDPYINLMTGDKILYQYNFAPIEQGAKSSIALAIGSSIKIIELKLSPDMDDRYIYDRAMGVFAIPVPDVVCIDKSDLPAGYVRFELEIPADIGGVFILHDGMSALVLSR